MINIAIIELGSLLILIYIVNYTYPIKKLLGGNRATFRRVKPFDCFQCMAWWVPFVTFFFHCEYLWLWHIPIPIPTTELAAFVLGTYLTGAMIQIQVEQTFIDNRQDQ